jgi:hypothetical protein
MPLIRYLQVLYQRFYRLKSANVMSATGPDERLGRPRPPAGVKNSDMSPWPGAMAPVSAGA